MGQRPTGDIGVPQTVDRRAGDRGGGPGADVVDRGVQVRVAGASGGYPEDGVVGDERRHVTEPHLAEHLVAED